MVGLIPNRVKPKLQVTVVITDKLAKRPYLFLVIFSLRIRFRITEWTIFEAGKGSVELI
jgi:hypothetical protein